MYKYYTKTFNSAESIDKWLKSFEILDKPASEGNCAEIVGYVAIKERIVITVKRWEALLK